MKNIILALFILCCLTGICVAQEGNGISTGKTERTEKNAPLKILVFPKAEYTQQARENNISGEVILKIEFLKDGKIGKITVVQLLPYGLTEQAMIAAKRIQFLPERKNGKNSTVTKAVSFNFSLK